MTTYYAMEDDNLTVITVVLSGRNGPPDLTGCTVSWIMTDPAGTITTISATPHANQTTNRGEVSVTLTSTHLANANMFNVQWQATCGSAITTYPNTGYDTLLVTADLS